MKIREHRGGYADSMATTAEIEPTILAVVNYVMETYKGSVVHPDSIKVRKYGAGVDARNGWDTHLVTIEGFGVFGMTDGMPESEPEDAQYITHYEINAPKTFSLFSAEMAAEYYSEKDPIFDPEARISALTNQGKPIPIAHMINHGKAGSNSGSEHTHMIIGNVSDRVPFETTGEVVFGSAGAGMSSCFVRELLEKYSEEGKQNIVEAINKSAIFCPVK